MLSFSESWDLGGRSYQFPTLMFCFHTFRKTVLFDQIMCAYLWLLYFKEGIFKLEYPEESSQFLETIKLGFMWIDGRFW